MLVGGWVRGRLATSPLSHLVLAMVVVMVGMASAPDLTRLLLNFAVLVLSTLVSSVHAFLNVILHTISGAHQIGGGLSLYLDEVGQLTDTRGSLTALHARVVSLMRRVMCVMGHLHASCRTVS